MKKMITEILLLLSSVFSFIPIHAATVRYVQISTNSITQQSGNINIQGATISTTTISSATISNQFGTVTDKSTSTHSGGNVFTSFANLSGTSTIANTNVSILSTTGTWTMTGSTITNSASVINGTKLDNSSTTFTGKNTYQFLGSNYLNVNGNGAGGFYVYITSNSSLATSGLFFGADNNSGTMGSNGGNTDIVFSLNGTEDGRISHTTLGWAIHGTNTNDSAASGYVGEYISSVTAVARNAGATGTYFSASTFTLTAGDWDISAISSIIRNGATFTALDLLMGISTTDGNSGVGLSIDNTIEYNIGAVATTFTDWGLVIPSYRVSINTTTTYYLKMIVSTVSSGTAQYQCRVSARRMR